MCQAIAKADAGNSAIVGMLSETACAAFESIAAADQHNEAPPMGIDEAKQYFATF
jgi:hypothetical protein